MRKEYHLENYPRDTIYFCRKRFFSTNEMHSLKERKYLLMKKKCYCYSFNKKNQNVSADLTTESVHLLNSSSAAQPNYFHDGPNFPYTNKHTILAKLWGISINLIVKLVSDIYWFVISHFKFWKLLGLFEVQYLLLYPLLLFWLLKIEPGLRSSL